MDADNFKSKRVLIVAVPETAASALYGMVDVLLATGNLWQTLVRSETQESAFDVQIISTVNEPFLCGNGIPVNPRYAVNENPDADIVILPELWLGPDEHLGGRYHELLHWIRQQYAGGAAIYSACSGALMLAETGLLDGCNATSHWGYSDLFRQRYPAITFLPEPNLVFADEEGRILTAGGTTSWHDLAIHIIARHCSPGEALRIAKVYLLKWHGEGQLPFAALERGSSHDDALVRDCEAWLQSHYREDSPISKLLDTLDVPARTLKRRFKKANGMSLMDYLQNMRIEAAKRELEEGESPVDEVCFGVGYEDPSFFRRLFKRRTGLTPGKYRRMFAPIKSLGMIDHHASDEA